MTFLVQQWSDNALGITHLGCKEDAQCSSYWSCAAILGGRNLRVLNLPTSIRHIFYTIL
jgi:hypothetical protein